MRTGSGGGKPRTGYPQAMALLVTHTQTFWFYETKTWSSLKVIVRDHEHCSIQNQVLFELQANGGRTESSHTQKWLQSFLDCRPNHPRQQTNPLYFITLQLFTCIMMELHLPAYLIIQGENGICVALLKAWEVSRRSTHRERVSKLTDM